MKYSVIVILNKKIEPPEEKEEKEKRTVIIEVPNILTKKSLGSVHSHVDGGVIVRTSFCFTSQFRQ